MGEETRSLRILVTGGQGFLGGALVEALVALGFRNVAATARREAPHLERLGVEVVKADLTDRRQAMAATEGREVVFHTAAKAGVWGTESGYHAINVEATRYLLAGSLNHGVSYFIHTSSPSVTFQGVDSLDESEEAPYGRQPLNAYCKTKIQSEREVLECDGDMRTLALRPHLIYGPGDPHLLPRVFEASRKGRLVRVGDGRNLVDVTHIVDAVAAHLCALARRENPEIWGQAYFITSGEPIELWDWLDRILEWKGLSPVRRSVNPGVAAILARSLESLYRLLGKTEEPPLTYFSALQLGCHHSYSIEKARRLLGYEPAIDPYQSFQEQFQETARDWARLESIFSEKS